MLRAPAIALAFVCAAPAVAQQSFALPQGCEAYVTVQKRGCSVSHLFRCAGDPAGMQRRVDMDEQGLTYAGTIDAETQWIESWHPMAGITDRLAPDPADAASLTTLMETGVDTFDFRVISTPGDAVTVFRGQDRLTGESVTIDGVTLDQTEFAVTALDEAGNVLWETTGREFIHREWRTFLSGVRTVRQGAESWDSDNTPVEFIFPGEAGFLASTPRHDCGVMMSAAPDMLRAAAFSRGVDP